MDLGTVNGTFINGERIESERFYELLMKVKRDRTYETDSDSSSVWGADRIRIVPACDWGQTGLGSCRRAIVVT